jgi:hypothetical protein
MYNYRLQIKMGFQQKKITVVKLRFFKINLRLGEAGENQAADRIRLGGHQLVITALRHGSRRKKKKNSNITLGVTYATLYLEPGSQVKSIVAVYRLRMKSSVSSGTSGDIVLQTAHYVMGWNLLTQ